MELTPQHLNQYPIRTNLLIRLTLRLGNPHDGDEGHEKTLIIAVAAMLIGSSGLSFAGSSGTKRASGSAAGTQMNNSGASTSRGASELSPGDGMKDSRTTGMSRGATKGASEFTPGDKMNDARKK
jgi:hypothetical protein